jgi:hypothetical protein
MRVGEYPHSKSMTYRIREINMNNLSVTHIRGKYNTQSYESKHLKNKKFRGR